MRDYAYFVRKHIGRKIAVVKGLPGGYIAGEVVLRIKIRHVLQARIRAAAKGGGAPYAGEDDLKPGK